MRDGQPYTEPDNQAARWMTFAELAAIRGISKLSAVALVRRHGWRRQRDNQGRMTALVPAAWADTEPDNEAADKADDSADVSLMAGALAALEDALASAERRAEQAEQGRGAALALADRTLSQLAEASARAERAEDATEAMRRRVTVIQHDLNTANAQAVEAAQVVQALGQADDARKGRGLLARLRAAVRGE